MGTGQICLYNIIIPNLLGISCAMKTSAMKLTPAPYPKHHQNQFRIHILNWSYYESNIVPPNLSHSANQQGAEKVVKAKSSVLMGNFCTCSLNNFYSSLKVCGNKQSSLNNPAE